MAPTTHPMSYARRPHERMPLAYRMVIWIVILVLFTLVALTIIDAVGSLGDAARQMGDVTG